MPLMQTIRPLLLAPLGAIVVFTLVTLPQALSISRGSPGGDLAMTLLVYWFFTALVCYAAELLFVVPVLVLWPASRQPSIIVGATWGLFVSCCVVALVTFVLPPSPTGGAFWLARNRVAMLALGACGLVSGLAYSVMSRMLKASENR